jgi:hypothetical protein
MNREQLQQLLQSSIEDHRLDDSDRRKLNDQLSNAELKQEDRSLVRENHQSLGQRKIRCGW